MNQNLFTIPEFIQYLASIKAFIATQNEGNRYTFAFARLFLLPCSFNKYLTVLNRQAGYVWNYHTALPVIIEFYKEHVELETFESGHVILHVVYVVKNNLLSVTISVIAPGDLSPTEQITIQYNDISLDEKSGQEEIKKLYWCLADADLLRYTSIEEPDRNCFVQGGY